MWLHPFPISHKELLPAEELPTAQGLGRAAQPSPGKHIHLQTQGVSKPGWLPITGLLCLMQRSFMRSCGAG